jgi:hypothetical protein
MLEPPGFINADMHTMHMPLFGEEYHSGSLIAEDGFTGRILHWQVSQVRLALPQWSAINAPWPTFPAVLME